jgi:serine/threonine-protein kinase RsbW
MATRVAGMGGHGPEVMGCQGSRSGGKLMIPSPSVLAVPPSRRSGGERTLAMTACARESYRSTMRIRNDSGELDKLTRWIIGACDAARLSKKTAFAVQLCLDEAVANILEHGEGSARASAIAADLERSESEVVLAIEDDGGPFDPSLIAAPQTPQTLEAASSGGRGIHLIRQFSSRMEYIRAGGRNRLRLTFAD